MDNKYVIFETSIIGFFIGTIISTYNTYLISIEGKLGEIMNVICLNSLVNKINISAPYSMVIHFIITVGIFTLYGAIIGIVIKNSKKKILILTVITLIMGLAIAEQYSTNIHNNKINNDTYYPITVIRPKEKSLSKYFGTEARGDLNGDTIDDIAFIINRNDKERGTLYYLSSAITSQDGYNGTTLLFLGDKIKPNNIKIENQIITIESSHDNSSSTELFHARFDGTELILATSTATSTP